MKISVFGAGYVGAVTGACLAEMGNSVTCIDIDPLKVELVNSGKTPIFEPGLDAIAKKNARSKRLGASTEAGAVRDSDLAFICVGTPSAADGSTNISYVLSAAGNIGRNLAGSKKYCVVVVKSTVPPGTTEKVVGVIERASGKKLGKGFGACMNPEFLREGSAVYDFFNPDRIVIGGSGKDAAALRKLYARFKCPFLQADWRTAEMIKYASNAFLATKISFINELANACQALGIDVYQVAEGMGLDKRIGRAFLNAGAGFGGSCFPKDVSSLAHTLRSTGARPRLLQSVLDINSIQPLQVVSLLKEALSSSSLSGKKIAVLGLAFKEDTDDMREAPSIKVVNGLLAEGAKVVAHDPQAVENARKIWGGRISYAESARGALSGADACAILTAWKEYASLSLKDFKLMGSKPPVVVEGRNVLPRAKLGGLRYRGIGRKSTG